MRKSIIAITFVLFASNAYAAELVKPLSQDTTSWDGQAIKYPSGEPMVTGIKLDLPAGGKLPFHCHPYNTVGYILQGELEVEKLNGEKHKFHKGDTIVEVANTWHRGTNTSATENAELIGFYIGEKDKQNTVMMTDENKNLCK